MLLLPSQNPTDIHCKRHILTLLSNWAHLWLYVYIILYYIFLCLYSKNQRKHSSFMVWWLFSFILGSSSNRYKDENKPWEKAILWILQNKQQRSTEFCSPLWDLSSHFWHYESLHGKEGAHLTEELAGYTRIPGKESVNWDAYRQLWPSFMVNSQ